MLLLFFKATFWFKFYQCLFPWLDFTINDLMIILF